MKVIDIIFDKIAASGADGLCCYDSFSCGCGKDDLVPCCDSEIPLECVLAKAVRVRDYCKPENCEDCDQEECDGYEEASYDTVRYVPMES